MERDLGVPPGTKPAVFFNIVQQAFDPPFLNIMLQIFLTDFLKSL